jgi:hypothetical protein
LIKAKRERRSVPENVFRARGEDVNHEHRNAFNAYTYAHSFRAYQCPRSPGHTRREMVVCGKLEQNPGPVLVAYQVYCT